MQTEMVSAITDANNNPDIGAIVFTGAGRAFCAGADIKQLFAKQIDAAESDSVSSSNDSSDHKNQSSKAKNNGWVDTVRNAKPMIAAINGISMGVGLTLVLPFDYIIAGESAKFCCAFARMGVVNELASSHYLVQRMGFGHASEAALTARMIPADEAVSLGLADKLVKDDELLSSALNTANLMAANPASSLMAIKQLITQNGTESNLDLVQERELQALGVAYKSPAHREAVDAFIAKRTPNFKR